MTSFCMSSSLGWDPEKENARTLADERECSDSGAVAHGSTESGDDLALLRQRLGALERVLHGAAGPSRSRYHGWNLRR